MYITNSPNIGVGRNTQACPECPAQPTICEPILSGQINLLGLVFFISCIVIYFLYRKKIFHSFFNRRRYVKTLRFIGLAFLVLGILYFIQLGVNQSVNSDCIIKGVILEVKFWPSSIIPFLAGN